ncbi:GntR family transcriptional regulator [Aliarcobacter trophiarum LMG 25534]|uniref:GntR family transcriptional regulator n=1 Tax=Aliarcobacter trophiarum LMG 25534 TaxID=1032241 RepID=A0AAD0QIH3_9BACT|nr:DoxX family protein [Aliarcobacter trophiarum]AXK48310.1 putative membrane protein, DoxX family [Aliarcobacter trophiarum LMG 25534]RXJ93014.1 GntR family transcriptional regulator [Aliarcobacter trophiarum LMG 25534]
MRCCENKLSYILNEEIGKLILRVSIAGLMLFHGIAKFLNGIDGIKFLVTQAGLPEFFAYGVYLGEILFPILIILGLFTRISSLFFALTMVFAIFLAHSSDLFVLGKTGGPVIELPLLYLLASVSIMFIGAGKYSLDAKCNKSCKNN